jgi:rhodanese-related sulfurtransferase
MKLVYALTLAAAIAGAGISYAGDEGKCPMGGDKAGQGSCPAGGEKTEGGCPMGGGCCGAKETKVVELKLEELQKLVAEKKATIIDVNPAERYAKGHIPGAKNAKFDALEAKDLPADKGAQLVFYCASEKCGACEKAAKAAVAMGYTNVAVYRGGIAGWENAKQAVETGAKASS